ncbi:putative holin-like toxin [Lacticaseibacillus paracasei]|nr:putative holin-like toxin [Lacticaseibacillus paracasei]
MFRKVSQSTSVFQALSLMIAFSLLVATILNGNKK